MSATPGDGSATVSWTAPGDGGSAITSYTITPYIGSTAQTATTITGTPPATSAHVTGLTDGTAYTFTVPRPTGSETRRHRRTPRGHADPADPARRADSA